MPVPGGSHRAAWLLGRRVPTTQGRVIPAGGLRPDGATSGGDFGAARRSARACDRMPRTGSAPRRGRCTRGVSGALTPYAPNPAGGASDSPRTTRPWPTPVRRPSAPRGFRSAARTGWRVRAPTQGPSRGQRFTRPLPAIWLGGADRPASSPRRTGDEHLQRLPAAVQQLQARRRVVQAEPVRNHDAGVHGAVSQ